MKVVPTELPDAVVIEPQVFGDARGFFLETWSSRRFAELALHMTFVQDNWSRSKRGILRGLHFQLRHPQGKLVRVTQGEVFDVAVDLRRGSPTFGKWAGVLLSAENFRAFYIPPGFAHGFYVLSESADFQYKCTDLYAPEHERTLAWNDAALGIRWPIDRGGEPQLSEKDRTRALTLDELQARGEVFP
ncbi:MAG: dTDP-4-dehydrorhamnose 3,5-epimerase [Phycisphaerae bacterium]|jgi:dTDP-4-dehydrorhamnose 3,5-epimerase|nr:dTDP-4-dehydrorhamnose 3,5-epimerase [Phycisphaerae bacterium]